MSLCYPDWLRSMTRGKEYVFRRDEPVMVGVSFGKTSAVMAFLTREHGGQSATYMGFQNTGREHSQTYLFGQKLTTFAGLPIEWSEFRKPLLQGAAPKESRYEIVTPSTASRHGEPFEWMLETLAEYREAQGKTPIRIQASPHMRLCSAFLKQRVASKIAVDMGWDCYTTFIGFRADEPVRVSRIRDRETSLKSVACPLAEIGITKAHIDKFWKEQPFTLDCPENLGNCDGCFLKDQGDLSHNLAYEMSDEAVQWWIAVQEKYGRFDPSMDYARLKDEAPTRDEIRKGIVGGLLPIVPSGMTERRFRLLVAQELRRTGKNIQRMQCNCEASELLTDEDVEGSAGRPVAIVAAKAAGDHA